MESRNLKYLILLVIVSNACASIVLNCDYKTIDWGGWGQLYTCDVNGPTTSSVSTISQPQVHSFFFFLPHLSVKALRNQRASWKFIPNGLGKTFPLIKTLQIISVGVKEISKENFEGLNSMVDLNLWNNDLTTVGEDVFGSMTNLQGLYLSKNKIKKVHIYAFTNLPKLEVLHLNENQIETLPRGIFKNNLVLKEIFLNSNKFAEIPHGSFDHLTNLKNINLSSNVCISSKYSGFSQLNDLNQKLINCDKAYAKIKEIEEEIARVQRRLDELNKA